MVCSNSRKVLNGTYESRFATKQLQFLMMSSKLPHTVLIRSLLTLRFSQRAHDLCR